MARAKKKTTPSRSAVRRAEPWPDPPPEETEIGAPVTFAAQKAGVLGVRPEGVLLQFVLHENRNMRVLLPIARRAAADFAWDIHAALAKSKSCLTSSPEGGGR